MVVGSAVGACSDVVGVAQSGGSGAAAGGAAEVAGGEVAALGGGDAVAQGLEAGDLPEGAEQDAGDAGVAEQRLDPGAGLWSGPGGGGAGLLGADPALAGHRGVDGVGEGQWLVVGAAGSALGAGGLGVLGGGPAGGQDVVQLRAQAAGVAELAVAQDLLGEFGEGVGAALSGGAGVEVPVASGERFQGGEERFGVFGGQPEPAEQAAVVVASVGEVALGVRPFLLGLEDGFAVGGDLVADPLRQLGGVHGGGDGDQVRLRLGERVRVHLADQPREDGGLLLGQDPVQDGVADQRHRPEQPGGAELGAGVAGGGVLEVGEPAADLPGLPGVVGDHSGGAGVELSGGGRQPPEQPADLRRDDGEFGLQLGGGEGVEGGGEQHVDQRREGAAGGGCCRGHAMNLSATSDSSAPRKRLWQEAKTLWTDVSDCRTRVRLGGCAEPVVAAPALAARRPADRRPGRALVHVTALRRRNVMRSGTTRRLGRLTHRHRAGRPAERPPPPRTPQDASTRPRGTSCRAARSAACAAGRRPRWRGTSCEAATSAAYGAGRSGPRTQDVLRSGHLRRVRRRTQRPGGAGRPAERPLRRVRRRTQRPADAGRPGGAATPAPRTPQDE